MWLLYHASLQVACVKSGLAAVLLNMWPSCTVNRHILVSVLNMLCVFTAQHPAGMLEQWGSASLTSQTFTHNIITGRSGDISILTFVILLPKESGKQMTVPAIARIPSYVHVCMWILT